RHLQLHRFRQQELGAGCEKIRILRKTGERSEEDTRRRARTEPRSWRAQLVKSLSSLETLPNLERLQNSRSLPECVQMCGNRNVYGMGMPGAEGQDHGNSKFSHKFEDRTISRCQSFGR